MSLVISDSTLHSANMSPGELSAEIAVMLFQKGKITLAQASRLAGMNRLRFQHLLASREICVHYDVEDFDEDVRTLKRMGRL